MHSQFFTPGTLNAFSRFWRASTCASLPLLGCIVLFLPAHVYGLVTRDTAGSHVIDPNNTTYGNLKGVAYMQISDTFLGEFTAGTATLLFGGEYVLTAAHLFDDNYWGIYSADNALLTWELPSGDVEIDASFVTTKHPQYQDWGTSSFSAGPMAGFDVALIRLNGGEQAQVAGVERYQLGQRGGLSAQNQEVILVGYGLGGHGNTGQDLAHWPQGTKRAGKNRFESIAPPVTLTVSNGINSYTYEATNLTTQIVADFDNGSPTNDAFGFLSGIPHTGYGADEVGAALGDSGGPTFLDERIVGVHSWGFNYSSPPDVDSFTNVTFGEFMVDANVTAPAIYDWIDRVAYENAHTESEVNPGLDPVSAWEDPDTWSYGGVPQSNETAYIDPWTDSQVYIEGPGYIGGPATTVNVAGTVVGTGQGYKGLYLDWGGNLNNTNDLIIDTNGYVQLTWGNVTADRIIVQGTASVLSPPNPLRGTFFWEDSFNSTSLSVDRIIAGDGGDFTYNVGNSNQLDANHLELHEFG